VSDLGVPLVGALADKVGLTAGLPQAVHTERLWWSLIRSVAG
jgi:hypothetical protein